MNAKQKRMRRIVDTFQKYVATYTNQESFDTYSDRTFIEDMLYGVGIALNGDRYFAAGGYRLFKDEILRQYVTADQPVNCADGVT